MALVDCKGRKKKREHLHNGLETNAPSYRLPKDPKRYFIVSSLMLGILQLESLYSSILSFEYHSHTVVKRSLRRSLSLTNRLYDLEPVSAGQVLV